LESLQVLDPLAAAKPTLRILVVDDDLDTVHSLAMLIKAFGYQPHFAINGLGAIDVARKFCPDVILVDINLPDIDGDMLARQLRFEPGLENVRILALSGRADEETRKRALEAGCEAFYVKPLEPDTLERYLAGHVSYSAAGIKSS
jgi:CheY-like chemotaxis protein